MGIPAAVTKRFSRRTALIEQVAAERGITDPKKLDGLGAETREKKNKAMGWNELREVWDSRLTNKEREAVAAQSDDPAAVRHRERASTRLRRELTARGALD